MNEQGLLRLTSLEIFSEPFPYFTAAEGFGKDLSSAILGWLETLSADEVEQIAGIATFSLVALMTTSAALRENLIALRRDRSTSALPRPRTALGAFNAFIGFDALLEEQQKFYR